MKEENVTKILLKWLIENDWKIICFDFPQSGTGILLHPNISNSEKNKDGITPDIIAIKETTGTGLLFENKDHYCLKDYIKMNNLIEYNNYSISINKLLYPHIITSMYFGIGLPTKKHLKGSKSAAYLVDFIVGVNEDLSVDILHKKSDSIFL